MTTLHAVHLPCDEDTATEPAWSNQPIVSVFADDRAPITAVWRRTAEGARYLDITISGVSVNLSVGAQGNLATAITTAPEAGAR